MTSGTNMIPDWDYDGVLPAIEVDEPTSRFRSPYTVSLSNLVERFGDTQPRRRLLRGLLDFRTELHGAGLTRGFQWINGSFVVNVEKRNGRPPDDIDIVTFLYVPDGYTAETLLQNFGTLFDEVRLEEDFSIDAYFGQLNHTTPEDIINESTYWYSIWSHTRGGQWKGYLQIDLAGNDDDQARLQLDQLDRDEGGQS